MRFIRILLREPLVHFPGLSLLIFLAYGAARPLLPEDGKEIVVSPERIKQIETVFAKTWQRPPTATERQALVDDFVTEDIYVREARKLGLDTDDTVIRRRLRLKMEFLADAQADLTPPSDAELQTYLATHHASYATPPRYDFEQVFEDAARRGVAAENDTLALLETLNGPSPPDPRTIGDSSQLPASMENADEKQISRYFGGDFAAAIASAPPGKWIGPIQSAYGIHFVKVRRVSDGQAAFLAEVREQVLRDWTNDRRASVEAEQRAELRTAYTVAILPGSAKTQ